MTNGDTFDKDEALFLSIMYSFHAAAMQQMGKIANPFTGKIERDLDGARGTIDVLLMFHKKTEGNLTDRERRVLTNLITELQLNFVDESKREPAAAEEKAPAEGEAPAPGADEAEAEKQKVAGAEEAAPAVSEERPTEAAEAEAAEAENAAEERPKKKAAKKRRAPKKKKEP
jgi:hypothetical protein